MALKSDPLSSPILKVFSFYTIPSLIGLLAMSSATLVDGIFVGHFVGANALAAINLIFPFLSLLFALALMLGVGGSVRAGKYLGEKNPAAASAIFSKTMYPSPHIVTLCVCVCMIRTLKICLSKFQVYNIFNSNHQSLH